MKILGLHILTDKKLNEIVAKNTTTIAAPDPDISGVVLDRYRENFSDALSRLRTLQDAYQDLLKENTQLNIAMGKVADIKDLFDSFERVKGILRKQ